MKSRVVRGEYSLKYWLRLMISRKISLPDYQRYFVWDENQVRNLIGTFDEERFVPPVIIGAYGRNGSRTNYIIDGQQRLTSVLLASVQKFLDGDYAPKEPAFSNGETESDPDQDELPDINVKEWKYTSLLTDDVDDLLSLKKACMNRPGLKDLDLGDIVVDEHFLATHFLGFCYITPTDEDEPTQQSYYAKLFRDLNVGGTKLSPIESRESLYFMKSGYDKVFDPDFAKSITIKGRAKNISAVRLDFVRYMSLLFEYLKDGSESRLARGYKTKMEQYYEKFICDVIGTGDATVFGKPWEDESPQTVADQVSKVGEIVKQEWPNYQFVSIIDMDITFFGLFYFLIIKKGKIAEEKFDQIKNRIQTSIKDIKDPSDESKKEEANAHMKSPSALKYVRDRVRRSIEIYQEYISYE